MNEAPEAQVEAPYRYSGPEALRAPIEAALRHVVDPEIALNVVDVGLVRDVAVTDEALRLQMTMTSAACPVTDVILADVEAELARVAPAGCRIAIELVWEPPWSPDRMSLHAKAFMGW